MIRNASAALAALAVVASAAAQVANEPPTQPGPQATTAAASAGSTEARRVVRDKATGKLRAPTTEELQEMLAQERAARAARGLPEPGTTPVVVRQHSNGMKSAVLGADYLVSLQAQRGPDGKLAIKHGEAAYEHASQPASAAKE